MNTYKDDLLLHDGQPGMHWGVRKYRNYDGTLTPAGRERYGVGPEREKHTPTRAEKRALKKIKKKASINVAKKEAKKATKEAKEAAEQLKKEREALEEARNKMNEKQVRQEQVDLKKIDNAELAAKIERLKLEQQYNELVNPKEPPKPNVPKKTLMQKLSDFSKSSRDVVALAKDVAGLVSEINKAKNGENPDPNKALKVLAEADKLKYEMESRNRQRDKWASEGTKTSDSKSSSKSEKAPASEPSSKKTNHARDSFFDRVSKEDASSYARDSYYSSNRSNRNSNADGTSPLVSTTFGPWYGPGKNKKKYRNK